MKRMKVVAHEDIHEFWRLAAPIYTADPVRHTLAISVLDRLRRGIGYSDEPPVLLTAHDDDTLIGAVFWTPPFPLNVGALPAQAAPQAATFLRERGYRPRGASGERAGVEAFAAAWRSTAGVGHKVLMDMRLYRLAELTPPADVPGELSFAGEDEFALLVDWRRAFARDTQQNADLSLVERAVRDAVRAGSAHGIWRVDGRPVALGVASKPSEDMSRVGVVYTPPAQRGHGYGSAVTAAVSQWALDQGARDVVLFTDLANPISNSIYQRIGYRPVLDALEVTFLSEPAGSASAR